MDLVTLVTACALAVDPKLMHALVWHQSGGEPWAVSVQGEPNPRVYPSMDEAIRETAPAPLAASFVSVSPGFPCRHRKSQHPSFCHAATSRWRPFRSPSTPARCKTHPRLKADPTFCAVAVYRGSWEQPDVKFATDIATSVAKGDAPNFDMPKWHQHGDLRHRRRSSVRRRATRRRRHRCLRRSSARSWSSALFPPKSKTCNDNRDNTIAASSTAEPSPSPRSPAPPQRKANRKTVTCSCVAQATSVHNDAVAGNRETAKTGAKMSAGREGTRQHDRRRAR